MESQLQPFQSSESTACEPVDSDLAPSICQQLRRPVVFPYENLWQHSKPILELLSSESSGLPLNSLGGTYGWPVRYRQEEDYVGLSVETLADYIEAFESGTKKLPYLRHISVNRLSSYFREQIKQPVAFSPNWVTHPWLDRLGGPELFIGQAGTSFGNLHRDHGSVHVGFVQLSGTKEFVLFPPTDEPYVYSFEGREFPYQNRATRIHYRELSDYDKFPLLHHASPLRIALTEGQALLMPANWFHTTLNITDSVSYSIRIVNSTNVISSIGNHISGVPRWLRKKIQKK